MVNIKFIILEKFLQFRYCLLRINRILSAEAITGELKMLRHIDAK